MTIEYLVHFVLPYVWLALGLFANVYLFITLKQEIRTQGKRFKRRQADLEDATGKLGSQFERTRAQSAKADSRPATALVPVSPAVVTVAGAPAAVSGVNLTKRSQAMRMLQRGERRERVAAALHLPHGEVDLLYKVQGILAQGARDAASKPNVGGGGSQSLIGPAGGTGAM
jgi:hypothetical protein